MTNYLAKLNMDDTRPVSVQIADAIRDAIHAGHLQPGDAVPSTNALSQHYDVSTNTVQAAMRRLRAAGLVASQPGRGTYVREGAAEAAAGEEDLAARVAALEVRVAELEKRL